MYRIIDMKLPSRLSILLFIAGCMAPLLYSAGKTYWQSIRTRLVLAQSGHMQAFTLKKTVEILCNGSQSIRSLVEARRSNGDWVTVFERAPNGEGPERHIRTSSGFELRTLDDQHMKTTFVSKVPLGWTPSPNDQCIKAVDGSNFIDWSVVGREQINRIETIKVKRQEGYGWYAPSLHCAELRRESTVAGPPGKPPTLNRITVSSISLGDPDAMLFDTATFTEKSPSELFISKKEVAFNATPRSEEDHKSFEALKLRVRNQLKDLDQKYGLALQAK